MKKQILTAFLVAIAFFSCKKSNEQSSTDDFKLNFVPAKTSAELIKLRSDKQANIIRSVEDFDVLAKSSGNPISNLSAQIQKELKASLVVREGAGVVGLNYSIIKKSITKEEFHQVMSLFGLDTKMGFWGFSDDPKIKSMLSTELNPPAEDYKEYKCLSAHTCQKASDHICLTGC